MNEARYRDRHADWKKSVKLAREKVTTYEGIMYALVMFREQRSQLSMEDRDGRDFLDETIKYLEEKLHALKKVSV